MSYKQSIGIGENIEWIGANGMSRSTKVRILPDYLKRYCAIESLLYLFAYHGAAVLAKEKPSFLINIKNKKNGHPLLEVWDRYKHIVMRHIECEYYELQRSDSHCVVLIYHKEWIRHILTDKESCRILQRFGYPTEPEPESHFECLRERYHESCPHEIGVFLGYPSHDVECFLDCPTRECQLVGYWKVFEHEQEAIKTFERYDQVRNKTVKLLNMGIRPSQVVIKNVHTWVYS